ncbi:MAG: hypothetical protein JSS86_05585, partial [Cyanobacteria bacterium SZAS LIN-2]|nr:hypothetical protein [Cyanobacteria bacterium SZAS LIN-2]
MRRAIAVERRARYSDFQGRHSTFSHFMRVTSDRLMRRYPLDAVWVTVRSLFRQYPQSDVATRISIINRAAELLQPYWEVAGISAEKSELETAAESVAETASKPASKPESKAPDKTAVPTKAGATAKSNPAKPKAAPAQTVEPAQKGPPTAIPVQYVKGVGPKLAGLLATLDIATVDDLLRHYPRRHLDFQNRECIKDLKVGEEVTIFGSIRSVSAYQSKRGNMSILSTIISDGTGSILVIRFVGGKSNKYLL